MIDSKVSRILEFLYSNEMVNIKGHHILATTFGRRISELYIDPESAVIIREGITSCGDIPSDIGLLHLAAKTPDLSPKLHPRRREVDALSLFAEEHRSNFLFKTDYLNDYLDYEEFLAEVKSVKILLDWIDETSENDILKNYFVEPGDLLRLVELSEWLLYAIEELAKLFKKPSFVKPAHLLQVRIKSGIKSELIPLVMLKGIGRLRARILFDSGFKQIEDLKKAHLRDLIKLPSLGLSLSKSIKEQVGGVISKEEWDALKRSNKRVSEQKLISEYPEINHEEKKGVKK